MSLTKIVRLSNRYSRYGRINARTNYSAPFYQNKEAFLQEIINGVLYQDKNLLAVNKPNEISMHGLKDGIAELQSSASQCYFSLSDVKPELCSFADTSDLYECYSQNRLYSGIILYAKNKETQENLQKYFRHVRANKVIHQDYWTLCMTNETSMSMEGQKDIYLKRERLKNVSLGYLVDKPAKRHRKTGDILTSFFKYRTLNNFNVSTENLSLMELQPILTKWDALTMMLETLNCCILGDHKYANKWKRVMNVLVSSKTTTAPSSENDLCTQTLTDDLRRTLKVTSKQMLPLHVHCRRLIVPRTNSKKKTLKIMAPLPDFFKYSLNCLKKNDKLAQITA